MGASSEITICNKVCLCVTWILDLCDMMAHQPGLSMWTAYYLQDVSLGLRLVDGLMNTNVEFSLDSQKETAGESENNQMKWYASAKAHLKERSAVYTVLLKPVKWSVPLKHCQTTLQNDVFKGKFLVTPTVPATSNSTWCIHSIFLLHSERGWWISSFCLPARCCFVCPLLQQ